MPRDENGRGHGSGKDYQRPPGNLFWMTKKAVIVRTKWDISGEDEIGHPTIRSDEGKNLDGKIENAE